jgi:hypothetical protein
MSKREFNPDFGVYICEHIFKKESPVLLVVRDEELSWQFLCGGSLENDPCHLVGVGHLLARDDTLQSMADLPIGHYAERDSIDDPWNCGELEE